ncbi:MAG TPA: glycosyltransferase [Hyalangium sp.]|nr:glycosyltransferase [Hyalangium sp.]
MRRTRARILMLTFEYGPIRCGGLATLVTALCRAIDLERFEPVVVLPRSGCSPPWPRVERRSLPYCEADIYRDGGCEVWLLSNPVLDSEAIYPEPFVHASIKKTDEYGERVAELLGELRVDLVHLHDAYGYKCIYEARRLGLPSLLTVHRLHEDEPPLAFAELATSRLVDEVSTVSHSYLREREDFFRVRHRTHVVPNGIDTTFWTEDLLPREPGGRPARLRRLLQELGLPERPTFAYVGRLDGDQKGLDVLIEAYERHLRSAPVNLLVVGEGERALAERLAAAAASGENLRFIHRQHSPEEVRALLGAVDFILIPSRYEPFGLIQLEAMAMGTLPIVSRVGGLRDVIVELGREGGFGRSFEAGSAEELASSVQEMTRLAWSAPEVLTRARHAARMGVASWSAATMARRYEELYRIMLGAGTAPEEGVSSMRVEHLPTRQLEVARPWR